MDDFAAPLTIFVELLDRWRKVTNLVAEKSFTAVWTRHIADSAQLLQHAVEARRAAATHGGSERSVSDPARPAGAPSPAISAPAGTRPGIASPGQALQWLDLGTGAGFPGLVIAILLSRTTGAKVHCVEADKRKCAFLREAARATGAPAIIHPKRIEALDADDIRGIDIVSARAFSPLPRLLEQAEPWLAAGAVGIFPRGGSERQLTLDAALAASYEINAKPSVTDSSGRILIVKSLKVLS